MNNSSKKTTNVNNHGLFTTKSLIEKLGVGLFWLIFNFFVFTSVVFAVNYPTFDGFVTDDADLISDSTQLSIEEMLSKYNSEKSVQIAVVTVKSLQGEIIEDYAVKLFEKWGIGDKNKDNGVLFLISKDDRKMRIEVGYGLEGEITDGDAGTIIRDIAAPSFKNKNYDKGISDSVKAIMANIDAPTSDVEKAVGNNELRKKFGGNLDFILQNIGSFLFFIPVVFVYLTSFMARTKDVLFGGIVGGVFGGLLGLVFGSLAWIIGLGAMFGFGGILLDWILSRNYKNLSKSHRDTGWFSTYGGFGGGGNSGGFGGFGGGSSGGGGGSGDW